MIEDNLEVNRETRKELSEGMNSQDFISQEEVEKEFECKKEN